MRSRTSGLVPVGRLLNATRPPCPPPPLPNVQVRLYLQVLISFAMYSLGLLLMGLYR